MDVLREQYTEDLMIAIIAAALLLRSDSENGEAMQAIAVMACRQVELIKEVNKNR